MTAAYDLTGNRISITYPDGRVVASSYDMLNRLSTVNYQQWGATIIGSTYWTAASYAPPGLLQTANYGNGVQMQAGFNSRLSLTSLSYQSTSPTPPQTLFSKNYQWDQNATNLLGEIDQITTKQRQFGYDNLNRLVSAEDVAVTAAAATGTVEITGFEGFQQVCDGGGGLNTQAVRSQTMAQPQMPIGGCTNVYDTGSIYITVGGYTVSAPYHRFSTSIALANALNALLNAGGSPVAATVSGSTITLTAKTAGLSGDYPLSYSTDGDFDATFSGSTMMGGQSAQPIPGGLNDQYALDAWGNLSQMGGTSGGFSQPINQQNQVSTFSYDAAGRLLNDYVTSYSYDDDGMLLTSSDGTSYAYDALGFRAQDSQGGVSKEYYYFGGQLVATLNPATAAWTDMIYAGDQKIAVVAGNQTAPPVYLLPDHLGSEAASVDSNGNLLASLDYTPFGQVISGSSTDTSIFTGLERDQSGLDHATFRQYSSNTGRWTVPDPNDGSYQQSDPQSLNRYVYSRNNPLAFTDPTGLQQGTNGDPPISGGGGDCPLCDDFINFVINGIGDLIGQAPQFTGNAPQQAQGKSLRRQITNRNPNAPDNPNDSMGRGSSGGVSSGYFGGIFYINGDPSHAPNKACSSQPSTGFYTNKQFQADAGILSNELGVPANLVMTVAGAESTYGTSRFATQGNNYFGMHAGATGSVGPFAGNPIMAAFPSGDGFLLSGQSFVHAVRPLLSGLKNPADPTQFFTAIHAKFGVTTPNYVRTMVGNAGMATIRMQCP
jgi:RHS repeat-associated protein